MHNSTIDFYPDFKTQYPNAKPWHFYAQALSSEILQVHLNSLNILVLMLFIYEPILHLNKITLSHESTDSLSGFLMINV